MPTQASHGHGLSKKIYVNDPPAIVSQGGRCYFGCNDMLGLQRSTTNTAPEKPKTQASQEEDWCLRYYEYRCRHSYLYGIRTALTFKKDCMGQQGPRGRQRGLAPAHGAGRLADGHQAPAARRTLLLRHPRGVRCR